MPGGVGPMTVAMLLSNTVDSAKQELSKEVELGEWVGLGKKGEGGWRVEWVWREVSGVVESRLGWLRRRGG